MLIRHMKMEGEIIYRIIIVLTMTTETNEFTIARLDIILSFDSTTSLIEFSSLLSVFFSIVLLFVYFHVLRTMFMTTALV